MTTKIETTKEELTQAMHAYHLDFLKNPDKFEEVTDSKDDAEEKVEMLIEYLTKLKTDKKPENQEEYLKELMHRFNYLKEFIDSFPSDAFKFRYDNKRKWCVVINLDLLKPKAPHNFAFSK